MTAEKIQEVLLIYDKKLKELMFDMGAEGNDPWNEQLEHAQYMLEQTSQFAAEGRVEKAFRWLGFIQGILWCNEVYSIDEMKEHNRP